MSLFNKSNNFDYFTAFTKISEHAVAAANGLNEALINYDYASISETISRIHVIEHSADANKHEIIEHLSREFLAPIEIENIVDLAQYLDNVVDAIDDVLRRIYMYDIKTIRPETLEFTKLLVEICEKLQLTVEEFRNFKTSKKIKDMIIEVNTCESRGDTLHFEYTHKLFAEETSEKDIIAWMTLFDALEMCFDSCEDAADSIESVIMKNT